MSTSGSMRFSDLAVYLGVSKQRVNQLAAEGRLPPPPGIDHRGRYWETRDLKPWAEEWAAARRWRKLAKAPLGDWWSVARWMVRTWCIGVG